MKLTRRWQLKHCFVSQQPNLKAILHMSLTKQEQISCLPMSNILTIVKWSRSRPDELNQRHTIMTTYNHATVRSRSFSIARRGRVATYFQSSLLDEGKGVIWKTKFWHFHDALLQLEKNYAAKTQTTHKQVSLTLHWCSDQSYHRDMNNLTFTTIWADAQITPCFLKHLALAFWRLSFAC